MYNVYMILVLKGTQVISLNELCTKVIITSKDCCASGLNEDVMSNSRDIEDCLKGISVVEI